MKAREMAEMLMRHPDDEVVFVYEAITMKGDAEVILTWDGINESRGPDDNMTVVDVKVREIIEHERAPSQTN